MAEINVPHYHTEIQTEFRSPARICIFTVKGMATNGHGRLHRIDTQIQATWWDHSTLS